MPKFWSTNSSRDAFLEVLYREHYPRLFRIVYALTEDRTVTEDAIQETFLKVFTRLNQLKEKDKFTSWVTTIAINEARTILRRPDNSNVTLLLDETAVGHDESDFSLVEIKEVVSGAMSQLKVTDKEILALRYFSDLDINEIAEFLNITPANVKTRLYRARASFRNVIEEVTDPNENPGGEP